MAKKFDPYDELGIDRDASKADVQKAYRGRAAKTHPDAPGGSAESFALVKRARDVLSDGKRRSKFDATGQIDDKDGEPNNIDAQAKVLVMEVLNDIISGEHEVDPCAVDLVDIIRKNLKADLGKLVARRHLAESQQRLAQRMEKKFKKRAKGPNLLSRMAQTRAEQEGERIVAIDVDIEILKRAIAFVSDYMFEVEKPEFAAYDNLTESDLRAVWGAIRFGGT